VEDPKNAWRLYPLDAAGKKRGKKSQQGKIPVSKEMRDERGRKGDTGGDASLKKKKRR